MPGSTNGFFGENLGQQQSSRSNRNNGTNINLLYSNVRGLNTKTHEFSCNLLAQNSDIIALTETWLHPGVFDAELFDDRYTVFRRDRQSRGGGVALAVYSQHLQAAQRINTMETDGEDMWIRLTFKRVTIFVCVVYFPPNSNGESFSNFFEKLEISRNIVNDKYILILGDFNLHSCSYSRDELSYFLESFNLKQLNHIKNRNNRVLDCVYTNIDSNLVVVSRHDFPLVPEDIHHPTLDISIALPSHNIKYCNTHSNNVSQRWKFHRQGISSLKEKIATCTWAEVYSAENVDDAVEGFYSIINGFFDECFGFSGASNYRDDYPRWFSRNLIKNIKKKYFLHKLWKNSKSSLAYARFSEMRRSVKEELNVCYKHHIESNEINICRDPTNFWSFINSKRGTTGDPREMMHNNVTYSDPKEIADAFSKYFSSVYNTIKPILNADSFSLFPSNTSTVCDISSVTYDDIDYSIMKVKPKRSSGPDHIPAYLLKELGAELRNILYYLFNLSLRLECFPTVWKTTKVCPIHKKGDKANVQNYRPVAILSAPAKLLEIILHRKIWDGLGNMLVDEQHGFRPGRSIVSNLLCFNNYIEKRLDNRLQVDVVYTDFEKAFDRVEHDKLLLKLHTFGLSDSLLRYMASYLRNRQQYVSFGNHISDNYFTFSGVPQGSNLGPLLFTVFINDIGTYIKNSDFLLYADDLKLYRQVTSEKDAVKLQEDIDGVMKWSIVNELYFSTPKCHVLTYSRTKNPLFADYTMNNVALARVDEVKDLGILYKPDMTFGSHIQLTVERAYKMLGFMLRNSVKFKNPNTLRILYDSLVRSILESGSLIWSPHEVTYIIALEKVQKKFCRHLYRVSYGNYPYLFPSLFVNGCLGISTLQVRRDEYLCRHFFKLLHGIISNPKILQEIQIYVPDSYSRSRRHSLFYLPSGRTNIMMYSPLCKAIRIFNQLSRHIDIFHISYNSFKHEISILLFFM
jgi:hypothetical protein